MRYFNNPQSIGQLKTEYDQIHESLIKESIKGGDSDKFQRELRALENEYNMWLEKLRKENTIEKHSATTYFKNPKTLEELDNQYRVYIRKLSNQKGGDKLLEQIEKEYKRLKKEIKYNNGQLTLTQQLHREIIENNEAKAYKNEMKEAQRRSYRNRKYTKEDIQNLISRQKQIVYKAVTIYLKKGIVLNCDVAEMSNSDMMKIVKDKFVCVAKLNDEFDEVITETAYVLEALAIQNNVSLAKYNYQMEQLIGQYAKDTYITLEEKYADPIKMYNRDKSVKADKKYNKVGEVAGKIIFYMFLCGVPVFFLLIAVSEYSFNHNMEDLIGGIESALVIGGIEIIVIMIIRHMHKRKLKKRAKARTYDEL